MGRVITNNQCGDECTSTFSITYGYDLAGDLTAATNGTGVTLSYSYDSAMRPMSVASSWSDAQHPGTLSTVDPNVGYWPTGQIRVMTLGNGLAETAAYNNRLEPCRINVNSSGTYLASCGDAIPNGNKQDFKYGYSTNWNNGDVWSWQATGTQNFNRSYTYDGTDRLLTMSAPGDTCSGLSWTYDAWGNRTDQTVTGGSCGTSHVTVNTNNQLVGPPYQYDAAGNLMYDGQHTYFYDSENRIVQVDGNFGRCFDGAATACYAYDGEGRRVEKITNVFTDYVYDLSGRVVTELQGGTSGTFAKGYAYINGRLLAEYTNGTTYFAHTDHLGSTHLLTATNQSIYDSLDYLPFGEQIAGDTGTTHKFTGQERDGETGNDNFGARYYRSGLGRFMTADWATAPVPVPYADFSDPRTLNLYAYARNNPTSKADIDGHCLPYCLTIPLGAFVGGVVGVAEVYIEGRLSHQQPTDADYKAAVLKGAITGAVISATGGLSFATLGQSAIKVAAPALANAGAGLLTRTGIQKQPLKRAASPLHVAADLLAGALGGAIPTETSDTIGQILQPTIGGTAAQGFQMLNDIFLDLPIPSDETGNLLDDSLPLTMPVDLPPQLQLQNLPAPQGVCSHSGEDDSC